MGCSLLFSPAGESGDSGEPDGCGQACDEAGGQCSGDRCIIDCGSGTCLCPANTNCDLYGSDEAGSITFDCRQAHDCTIACEDGQCEDARFQCGTGTCNIYCFGQFACLNTSTVCTTGSCSLECSGLGACQAGSSIRCGDAELCSLECSDEACASMSGRCERAQSCVFECQDSGNNICSGASFDCGFSSDCTRLCQSDNMDPCQ